MTAQVSDGLYVETPEHRPLTVHEPHLTLLATNDDVRVTLDFDGAALDALADAIYHAQGFDALADAIHAREDDDV